jgi:hypothetical protein
MGGLGWLRWVDGPDASPHLQFHPGDSETATTFDPYSLPSDSTVVMKMRSETLPDSVGDDGTVFGITRYSLKIWPEGTVEPTSWNVEVRQVSEHALRKGAVALLTHHVDASFGTVQVTSLGGEDQLAKAAPIPRDEIPILAHVAGIRTLDEEEVRSADVSKNGVLTAFDRSLVLRERGPDDADIRIVEEDGGASDRRSDRGADQQGPDLEWGESDRSVPGRTHAVVRLGDRAGMVHSIQLELPLGSESITVDDVRFARPKDWETV